MSDRILVPYNFTDSEVQIIETHFQNHTDWEKGVFSDIKTNIVSYLRVQQNNICCYCKYPLGFDIKQVDIEHIIPKSEFEQFTFEARNLALSCPSCNTKKSTNSVLHSSIEKYPKNGNKFIIIHAHYDDYSEHINIVNKCVFVAKTSKGSETITFCELFRLSIAEEKAKAYQNITLDSTYQMVSNLSNVDQNLKQSLINTILNGIR